jgi:hypothetical protein
MGIPGLSQYDQRAVPLVQRTIAAASIGASYSIVGSIFSNPVVMLIILSTLDQTVQLSLDGSHDFIPIPAGGTLIMDEKTNGIVLSGVNGIYVKRLSIPSTGSLYVGGFTL